jgi:hypothetical protein
VVRAALVNIDVEFLDTAYKVEGVAASGNAGSTRHVTNLLTSHLTVPAPSLSRQRVGYIPRRRALRDAEV